MNNKKVVLGGSLVILALLLFVYGTLKTNPLPPAPHTTASFEPLNSSYKINGSVVRLENGVAGDFRSIIDPVQGDLNNDGREDAALILEEQPSSYHLVVAINSFDGKTMGTNSIQIEEWHSDMRLEIQNGSLVLKNPGRNDQAVESRYIYVWGTELRELLTRNEFLEINEPFPYQGVSNPMIISGRSNFFEANTRIRILDEVGNILADTFITAEGWMDGLYPFSGTITYLKPTSSTGVLEVFEESAEDGSPRHKISIPINFLRSS